MTASGDRHEIADREALIREFGLLLGAAGRLERLAAREFERRCGISHPMFEVLIRLSDTSAADAQSSMGGLAADLILTSGGMTRLIDRMLEAGLVRRYTSVTDRRRQLVELTDQGHAKLAEAKQVHAETLARHFAAPLTDEQRRDLVAALRLLNAHARQALGATLG